MDERLARILLNTAQRAARELAALPPLLKDHAAEEIRDKLRLPIGQVLANIRFEIEDPIFALFPQLRFEFEENVEQFGRSS